MTSNTPIQWPTELSEPFKQRMLSFSQRDRAAANSGDLPGEGDIHYLTHGVVAVRIYTLCGKSVMSMIRGQGEWLTTYSGHMALSVHVEPLTDCQWVSFANEKLAKLQQQSDEFYKLLHAVSQHIQARWLQGQLIGCYSAQQRVAYMLLELATHFPQQQVPLSQKQLSELSGVARQRVNEICRTLVAQKAIANQHSCIKVLHLQPFRALLAEADLSSHNPLLTLSKQVAD